MAVFSLEVDGFSGSGVIYGLLRKENPNNSEDESHHSEKLQPCHKPGLKE